MKKIAKRMAAVMCMFNNVSKAETIKFYEDQLKKTGLLSTVMIFLTSLVLYIDQIKKLSWRKKFMFNFRLLRLFARLRKYESVKSLIREIKLQM